MKKLSGKDFDTLFIKEAVRINAQDKTEAEKEKSETKDSSIKIFIGKFASMDAEHEKIAKQLEQTNG